MPNRNRNISYDFIIHPGETLTEVLADRDMSKEELSGRTGVPLEYVTDVIEGRAGISELFAERLEEVLGIQMSFWLNLQANYERELKEENAIEQKL